jgi:RNA polymerase sigma factor (sigma-70 family)
VKQDLPDAALAIASRDGDHAAFAVLMGRHKLWLYRFVKRYVADRDEAYDIVQESFVSVWSALVRYDTTRPFEAWLRRIALNKCRDRARRNAVRKAALAFVTLTQTAFGIEASTPPADKDWHSQNALKRLEQAVASLPRALKEPLVLTMLEGLSQKDAGEVLGINAKAVETRVYRAKKRLALMLDPSDLDDLAKRS